MHYCLQMHLPYLVKCFAGQPFKLVPIIVGALTPVAEEVRDVRTARLRRSHVTSFGAAAEWALHYA